MSDRLTRFTVNVMLVLWGLLISVLTYWCMYYTHPAHKDRPIDSKVVKSQSGTKIIRLNGVDYPQTADRVLVSGHQDSKVLTI